MDTPKVHRQHGVPVAGLDPAIQAFLRPFLGAGKTWVPGSSPGKGGPCRANL